MRLRFRCAALQYIAQVGIETRHYLSDIFYYTSARQFRGYHRVQPPILAISRLRNTLLKPSMRV